MTLEDNNKYVIKKVINLKTVNTHVPRRLSIIKGQLL